MITIGRKNDPKAEYIGRGSPLGNPFRIHDYGSEVERDEVVEKYREYFEHGIKNNDAMLRELRRLYRIAANGDLILGCFCAPKKCHGEVIKKFLDDALNGRS
jgi:hypothetical protein